MLVRNSDGLPVNEMVNFYTKLGRDDLEVPPNASKRISASAERRASADSVREVQSDDEVSASTPAPLSSRREGPSEEEEPNPEIQLREDDKIQMALAVERRMNTLSKKDGHDIAEMLENPSVSTFFSMDDKRSLDPSRHNASRLLEVGTSSILSANFETHSGTEGRTSILLWHPQEEGFNHDELEQGMETLLLGARLVPIKLLSI